MIKFAIIPVSELNKGGAKLAIAISDKSYPNSGRIFFFYMRDSLNIGETEYPIECFIGVTHSDFYNGIEFLTPTEIRKFTNVDILRLKLLFGEINLAILFRGWMLEKSEYDNNLFITDIRKFVSKNKDCYTNLSRIND